MTGSMTANGSWWLVFALGVAWKSVALLAIAGLTSLWLRRSAAAARHFVWGLGMAAALAVLPLSLALPTWSWRVLPASATPVRIKPDLIEGRTHPPFRPSATPHETDASFGQVPVMKATPIAVLPAVAKKTPWPAHVLALGVWLVGVTLGLLGPLLGRIALRKTVRGAEAGDTSEWAELIRDASVALGLRRRVTLLLVDRAVMPMTWGWLRPILLLPAQASAWEQGRRREVLLHELAHVRRCDNLTQALAQLACAAYWFNPLAWLAAARMRAERERACDDLVLAAGTRPSDYAGHLLQMARDLSWSRAAARTALAMARPSHLEGRLRAILDPDRARAGPGRMGMACTVALSLIAVVTLSAVRLNARGIEQSQAEEAVNASKTLASGKMTVTGRVLDPEGKPVRNAAVDVRGWARTVKVGAAVDEEHNVLLGRGETDGDGRFQLEALRTSSDRFMRVDVLAGAKGYGLSWSQLNPDAERPDAEVRLRPEQPVRISLVDANDRPASGVEVVVSSLVQGDPKRRVDGVGIGGGVLPEGFRAWPRTATSDEHGQFLLAGVGRDLSVVLEIRDMRYARQTRLVKTGSAGTLQQTTVALEPARIIEGRVLAADSGRPIPGAIIAATTHAQKGFINGNFTEKFQADAEGRFRINPLAGDEYKLDVFPPAGEPYLIARGVLRWTKGAVRAEHDFELRRGVVIRGKVTEAETGRPLAGSSVQFIPLPRNNKVALSGWQATVATGDDGVYQIVVPPGKGHLFIFGPTSDYVLDTTSQQMVLLGTPGGRRYYAHKIIAYDVPPGLAPVERDASLRTGKKITFRVVGPNGQTVNGGWYLTTLDVNTNNLDWQGDTKTIHDGQFEFRGLAPEGTARVDILDDEHEWGASVEVSGRQAGTELTVTLQPCGRAKARFVGPDGRPVAKHEPNFEYVATPGPHYWDRVKKAHGKLAADARSMDSVDRKHYMDGVFTDADGRITLPSLIPGARYRINDFTTVNDRDKGAQVRRDFTVKPGETLDLGDILIEKPGR